MKRLSILVVILLLFIGALAQSVVNMVSLSRTVSEREVTTPRRERSYHIAVFLPDQGTVFFEDVSAGVLSAADEYDVAVSFHPIGPGVDEFRLAQYSGFDGMIIYPYLDENEMLTRLDALDAAGIPVVLIQQDVSDELPRTFVGTNNFELGRRIGLRLADDARDERIVIVYSDKSPSVASERELVELGITTAIGNRLAAPIVRLQTGRNPLDAEALTYQLLLADPPVTTIVFADTSDTLAALQVIIDLNMVGQVRLIGLGVTEAILDYLERGVLDATIAVNPQRIGIESVRVLSELMRTGNAPTYVDTGVEIIGGSGG